MSDGADSCHVSMEMTSLSLLHFLECVKFSVNLLCPVYVIYVFYVVPSVYFVAVAVAVQLLSS